MRASIDEVTFTISSADLLRAIAEALHQDQGTEDLGHILQEATSRNIADITASDSRTPIDLRTYRITIDLREEQS